VLYTLIEQTLNTIKYKIMLRLCLLIALFSCIYCDNPAFDWRDYGAILPAPTQTECQHASVVNALDALSAQHQIRNGTLSKLSQQQIYDCSGNWCPCGQAGNASQVIDLIFKEELGSQVDSEESYPYTGQCTHVCHFNKTGATATSTGYEASSGQNEESILINWLKYGPVVVEVNSNTLAFKGYMGGVLDDPDCTGKLLDHVLLLVGYGTETGKDYWILRNSWGPNWGENGYIRIIRDKNMCGIGNSIVIPTGY